MVELQHPELNPPWCGRSHKVRARKVRSILQGQGECRCYLCGRRISVEEITLNHVRPKTHGGGNERNNLRICCRRCNQYRATMPVTYWRMLRGFVATNDRLELKQYAPHDNGGYRLNKVIGDAWSKV